LKSPAMTDFTPPAPVADLQTLTRSLLQTTAAYADAVRQIERTLAITLAESHDPAERATAAELAKSTIAAWLETARVQDREFVDALASQRTAVKERLTAAQQEKESSTIQACRQMITAIDKAAKISGKPVRVLKEAGERIAALATR
jgi:hypothetical protein